MKCVNRKVLIGKKSLKMLVKLSKSYNKLFVDFVDEVINDWIKNNSPDYSITVPDVFIYHSFVFYEPTYEKLTEIAAKRQKIKYVSRLFATAVDEWLTTHTKQKDTQANVKNTHHRGKAKSR